MQIAITNCRLWSFPGRWRTPGSNPLGMEAITRMECRLLHGYDLDFSPNRWWWKFGTAFNLLLFLLLLVILLFLLVLLLGDLLSSGLLLPLGRLRISSLFAGADSEPLWQLLGWAFRELCELLLPHGLQPLSADNLGATLVQLLAVAVCPGVCPPLVLGEHVNGGGVLLGEGLGVETLLDRLVPQLQLLPLCQLLELVILVELSLLVVILVGLQGDNGVPDLVGFVLQLFRVHLVKGQGLDTDGQGDLHLLLDLLLRLGHLFASVHGGSRGLLASLLLSGEHLLPFPLVLLHLLLLGLSLCFLLFLLLPLDLLLLCSLLRCLLLLLLSTDLLPGGLFVF